MNIRVLQILVKYLRSNNGEVEVEGSNPLCQIWLNTYEAECPNSWGWMDKELRPKGRIILSLVFYTNLYEESVKSF